MGARDRRLSPETPEYLAIGRIGRSHGVHGEVRVIIQTDFPDRFAPGARVLVGPDSSLEPTPATIISVRPQQHWILVRFDIAPDREAAKLLANQLVYIPAAQARPLAAGSYYPHQLTGLTVTTSAGRTLGEVESVMETGAAEVLVVAGGGKQHLIPMIADVVDEIDLAARCIVITPLPGLLDL